MSDNSLKTSQLPTALNVASTDRILILFNANNANAIPSTRTIQVNNFISSALSNNSFNSITFNDGSQQNTAYTGISVLTGNTVGTNSFVLTIGGSSAPNTTNQFVLSPFSAGSFSGQIVGVITAGNNSVSMGTWAFSGAIQQGANAATTTLTGIAPQSLGYGFYGTYIDMTRYVLNADAAFSNSLTTNNVVLVADTVNGGLSITVTGFPASNVMWSAQITPNLINY